MSKQPIYKISIKNKKVYDCMKRSRHAKSWQWNNGDSLYEWSPYDFTSCPSMPPDTPIVLFIYAGGHVIFTRQKLEEAIPWAQWCEERRRKENDQR